MNKSIPFITTVIAALLLLNAGQLAHASGIAKETQFYDANDELIAIYYSNFGCTGSLIIWGDKTGYVRTVENEFPCGILMSPQTMSECTSQFSDPSSIASCLTIKQQERLDRSLLDQESK